MTGFFKLSIIYITKVQMVKYKYREACAKIILLSTINVPKYKNITVTLNLIKWCKSSLNHCYLLLTDQNAESQFTQIIYVWNIDFIWYF